MPEKKPAVVEKPVVAMQRYFDFLAGVPQENITVPLIVQAMLEQVYV